MGLIRLEKKAHLSFQLLKCVYFFLWTRRAYKDSGGFHLSTLLSLSGMPEQKR